jgi:hypothetical protein
MSVHPDDLHRYLLILAGANPAGQLIEIRSATSHGGMRQTFTPATRPDLAAGTITRLAGHTDVYVGVLLRRRRAGGRDACANSHLVFIDIDHPDGARRLQEYRCPPTMVIASGGSPGHAHAYWQLQEPVDLDALEQANRRLAIRLGGDLAATDAPRVLRPPTSSNHKRTPPRSVELLELHPSRRYTLTELTAGLADSAPRHPPVQTERIVIGRLDRQLLEIPATTWALALTGRRPNRAGKINCPFHDDHTPSLQLYDHGWYCFGACRTGGSIYDFAALLYGLASKGRDFIELRNRLAVELRIAPAGVTAARPPTACLRRSRQR